MNPRIRSVTVYAVLCLGLGACSTIGDTLERIDELVRDQDFYWAYQLADEALRENPDNADLQRVHRARRIDYLAESGVELLHAERELEAIRQFQLVLTLAPDNRAALIGVVRCREELAKSAVRKADNLRFGGKIEEALKLYEQALLYVPSNEEAARGVELVNTQVEKRAQSAEEHYKLGTRARGEQAHRQTLYRADLATSLDPSMDKAKRMSTEAADRLAVEQMQRGVEMEELGAYFAALVQYEMVEKTLPKTPGLAERLARMKQEVSARTKRREAEMLIRKRQFDEADKLLAEAFALSQSEKASISGLMMKSKRRRFNESYLEAKDLELDYLYEGAIKAYEDLVAHTELAQVWTAEQLQELKDRISTLSGAVKSATESWQEGQAAEKKGDVKKAVEAYGEALLVYPDFRNLAKRIERLQGRR